MPVPSDISELSATAASNSPAGTDTIGTTADDYLRAIQAVLVAGLSHKGADIASAGTTDLGAVAGLMHDITGTTTITSFGTIRAGIWKIVKFEGALTLTHNATSLILPGGANVTTADGDIAIMISEGSGNWRCVNYRKATSGVLPVGFGMSPITASLGANVDLNNTGSYFTGPTIAQGTAGTWFVSGTVSLSDSAGAWNGNVKLWDGTTVISSARCFIGATNQYAVVALSGYISSPAGNLRISVQDVTTTTGFIAFNASGNSKDSTITAIRIA